MAEERIGRVDHYYPKAHAAVVHLERGALHVGDTIHIVGHGDDLLQPVKSLQMDHRPIREAHAGEDVGVEVADRVHEKADVYLIQAEA